MAKSPIPPPLLQKQNGCGDNIEDFICTICCEIALDPVVTPCEHVFCRPCIEMCVNHHRECPNDRRRLSLKEIKPLNGILRRIWEKIPVLCPQENCGWGGMLGNYTTHALRCSSRSSASLGCRNCIQLKREVQMLKAQITELSLRNDELEGRNKNLETKIAALEKRESEELWLPKNPIPPEANSIFVHQLPANMTDADLASVFNPFGNIVSAKVYIDKHSGESKGLGFVSYESVASAKAASEEMNGFQLGTTRLKVQLQHQGVHWTPMAIL